MYGDCADDSLASYDDASSCAELPAAWRALFQNEHFRAARASLAIDGMLDDHDYGRNDCDARWAGLELGKAIFLERFGVPRTDARWRRPGLYTSYTLGPAGQRTQILLLDTRAFRSPFVLSGCTDSRAAACTGRERYVPYSRSAEDNATILGEAQWAWLEARLAEPAELRLLVSTIQVLPQGHGWERWGLVPSEVRRLYRLLARTRASGVVLLSGDRHTGGIYRAVARSEDGGAAADADADGAESPPTDRPPYDLYEVTSSSLTHSFRTDIQEPGPLRVGNNTHLNNLGTIAVDWQAGTVTLDLRTSDDCGNSPQQWGHVCTAHDGRAGEVIMSRTLRLDELRVPT